MLSGKDLITNSILCFIPPPKHRISDGMQLHGSDNGHGNRADLTFFDGQQ